MQVTIKPVNRPDDVASDLNREGGQLPNPNECNSTLTSATRGEMLTPDANKYNSTLMSETRELI